MEPHWRPVPARCPQRLQPYDHVLALVGQALPSSEHSSPGRGAAASSGSGDEESSVLDSGSSASSMGGLGSGVSSSVGAHFRSTHMTATPSAVCSNSVSTRGVAGPPSSGARRVEPFSAARQVRYLASSWSSTAVFGERWYPPIRTGLRIVQALHPVFEQHRFRRTPRTFPVRWALAGRSGRGRRPAARVRRGAASGFPARWWVC